MATEFRYRLLGAELLLFASVMFLGLWVGWILPHRTVVPPKLETTFSIVYILSAVLIATVLIILALRFFKGKAAFSTLFAIMIVFGADAVFSTFLPGLIALILAVAIAALRFWKPNVLTHNLAVMLAVAGVGAQLGLLLTLPAIIILLIALSIYDFIAVFKTKHMVTMFKGMAGRGAPLAIVVSGDMSAWKRDMGAVTQQKLKSKKRGDVLMLGTGDLAFPLVFAVAALQYDSMLSYIGITAVSYNGLVSALFISAGALVGVFVIHYLMLNEKIRALPALPPLAISTIIAFGLSLLVM